MLVELILLAQQNRIQVRIFYIRQYLELNDHCNLTKISSEHGQLNEEIQWYIENLISQRTVFFNRIQKKLRCSKKRLHIEIQLSIDIRCYLIKEKMDPIFNILKLMFPSVILRKFSSFFYDIFLLSGSIICHEQDRWCHGRLGAEKVFKDRSKSIRTLKKYFFLLLV